MEGYAAMFFCIVTPSKDGVHLLPSSGDNPRKTR
jgi:hypothetical protein